MQSGSIYNWFAFDEKPAEKFNRFAKNNGCHDARERDAIQCLRDIPANDLNLTYSHLDVVFRPDLDGEFVKYRPNYLFWNPTGDELDVLKELGNFGLLTGATSAEGNIHLGQTEQLFESTRKIPQMVIFWKCLKL